MIVFQETTPLVWLTSDGQPRASTEAIALGYESRHKQVLHLVRKYIEKIERFGIVAFETRLNAKGSPTEYAMLNMEQAMFLLTLMRNNTKVVDFKVRLIEQFVELEQSLQNRDLTMWERRIRLEAKDMTSKAKGSMGSKLMLGRKKEIPQIDAERHLLASAMQPSLLN